MLFQLHYRFLTTPDLLDKFPVLDSRLMPKVSQLQFNYRSSTESVNPITFLTALCFMEHIANQRAELVVKRQSGGLILDPRLIAKGGVKEEGVKTFYSVKLTVNAPVYRIYNALTNLHHAWVETGWLIGEEGEGEVPLTPFPVIYSNRWESRPTYRLYWFNPVLSPQLYKRGESFSTQLALHIELTRPLYRTPIPTIFNRTLDEDYMVGDRLFGFVLLSAFGMGWVMVDDGRITNRDNAPSRS